MSGSYYKRSIVPALLLPTSNDLFTLLFSQKEEKRKIQ
jgi:hypothetical protein